MVRRPAASSQARTVAALKAFFRFLVEEERLLRDPALPLRTPKKREALPDVLTMGELERLLGDVLPGRGCARRGSTINAAPSSRSGSRWNVALAHVVRAPGRCRDPDRRSSRSRREAHAGT